MQEFRLPSYVVALLQLAASGCVAFRGSPKKRYGWDWNTVYMLQAYGLVEYVRKGSFARVCLTEKGKNFINENICKYCEGVNRDGLRGMQY